MSFFYEISVLEAAAFTLAVAMALGPLVPYALNGERRKRRPR